MSFGIGHQAAASLIQSHMVTEGGEGIRKHAVLRSCGLAWSGALLASMGSFKWPARSIG
jgi:hypothetical protein